MRTKHNIPQMAIYCAVTQTADSPFTILSGYGTGGPEKLLFLNGCETDGPEELLFLNGCETGGPEELLFLNGCETGGPAHPGRPFSCGRNPAFP